jgi:hypothetical protein
MQREKLKWKAKRERERFLNCILRLNKATRIKEFWVKTSIDIPKNSRICLSQ